MTIYDYSVKVACPSCGAKIGRAWRVRGPWPFSYQTHTLEPGQACRCGAHVAWPDEATMARQIGRARSKKTAKGAPYSGRTATVRGSLL